MSDDSAKQLIGTIGGFCSCAIFLVDATLANNCVLNLMERRQSQARGTTQLVPLLRDTRLLFYMLAVFTSTGYSTSCLLQLMVYPPIEVNTPFSDLTDCVLVAAYLAMVAMVFFTILDGVNRVRSITQRHHGGGSTAPSKMTSQLAPAGHNQSSNNKILSSASNNGRIASDKKPRESSAGAAAGGGRSSTRRSKTRKSDYRKKGGADDAEVVARFYGTSNSNNSNNTNPTSSDVSMTTNVASAIDGFAADGGQQLPPRVQSGLASSHEDSRAALRMASRGSGTFQNSDDDDDDGNANNHNRGDKDDGDVSDGVRTGSFLEGYESDDDWGTGYQQVSMHDRFGGAGASTADSDAVLGGGGGAYPRPISLASSSAAHSHSSMAALQQGNNHNSNNYETGSQVGTDINVGATTGIGGDEDCATWWRENRAVATMTCIVGYYLTSTAIDFIYQQATGEFVSFGAYGSAAACVIFGVLCAASGIYCVVLYRDLVVTAATAAETLWRLSSIFFILAFFLVGRAVIVFQPVQERIGASLLPATLYLADAVSILVLLMRVPKQGGK